MMGLPMSGLRKHRQAALLAAAAAVLAVAACGGGSGSSSGGSAIKQGGVFRMGTSSTIDSLNPFIAFQSDAYTTFEYIYPTLVQYTPSLQFVPRISRGAGRARRMAVPGPSTPSRTPSGPTASR